MAELDLMTGSLEEFLDGQLRALEVTALNLPARGELATLFIAAKSGNPPAILPVLLGDGAERALQISLFRAQLQAAGAERYAIVSAAWYVQATVAEKAEAEATIDREGTGGRYKKRRQECFLVSAGDRTRTLLAVLDVERDYKGKIRKLSRRASADSANLTAQLRGRMTDLLVTRH
jgi:hypothetical protein